MNRLLLILIALSCAFASSAQEPAPTPQSENATTAVPADETSRSTPPHEPAPGAEETAASPEEVPPEEPAPEEVSPKPTVTIDTLEARLAEVEAAIQEAQTAVTAEAPATIAELRAQRATALQDLQNAIQRRITSLKRVEEMRETIADVQQQQQNFDAEGLDTDPPYTITFIDQARDELEAARRDAKSGAQSIETTESAVEQAGRRLLAAETQRREVRDALDALPADTDRTEMELQLAIAQTNQELAEREAGQAETQRQLAELEKQANDLRAALMEQKVAAIQDSVVFTQKELQQHRDELAARQETLDRDLREARRTDTANQSRLESAREALNAARGEDNIRKATEALAAREAWAQTSSRAIELLQERTDNLSKAKALWERRFALRQRAEEAQLAQWERETSELLEDLQRRREEIERRLHDSRVTKAEVDNRLTSPDTQENIKPELESRVEALDKREEWANAYLAGLIGIERLAERVLNEVQEKRKIDSWRGTWSRIVFTSTQVWNRELFVIDDRGFRVGQLVFAIVFFVIVMFIAYVTRALMRRTVLRHLRENAQKTQSNLDDVLLAVLHSTHSAFIVAMGVFAALKSLPLSARLDGWINSFAVIVIVYQVATWANVAVQRVIDRTKKRRVADDPSSVSAFGLMSFFGRVAIWAVALLIILDNLGFEITALVAGLGVGGIAVAFALQNILGDVFCSIAILLDKPFVVGDFIIVGDLMGSVENIGIKTTRIRSLGGEQIVFSNADLIGSRIRNYKRMYERRIVFGFGVVYETPAERLEEIPGIVRGIVENIDQTRFDRAHFKDYGDFSLNFEVVYYVLVPEYNIYMDIQQRINLEIFRAFATRGIAFAYPTHELIVRRNGVQHAAAIGAEVSKVGES